MKLGIYDINGKALSAGDRVVVYAKRYEKVQVSYDVSENTAVEKPMADIPIAAGTIYYDSDSAAFRIRYEKPTEEGIANSSMSNSCYHYEIINHDRP